MMPVYIVFFLFYIFFYCGEFSVPDYLGENSHIELSARKDNIGNSNIILVSRHRIAYDTLTEKKDIMTCGLYHKVRPGPYPPPKK